MRAKDQVSQSGPRLSIPAAAVGEHGPAGDKRGAALGSYGIDWGVARSAYSERRKGATIARRNRFSALLRSGSFLPSVSHLNRKKMRDNALKEDSWQSRWNVIPLDLCPSCAPVQVGNQSSSRAQVIAFTACLLEQIQSSHNP